MYICDILKPRKDVLEGTFQGVIQTHKVDAIEKRLENNPQEFLKITYPSSAIKRALERIEEKLSKKSNQGGFLLVGPYGSGKSHTLITLYHLFNHNSLARDWRKRWKIDFKLPEKSRSVIVSTRRYLQEDTMLIIYGSQFSSFWEEMTYLARSRDFRQLIKLRR